MNLSSRYLFCTLFAIAGVAGLPAAAALKQRANVQYDPPDESLQIARDLNLADEIHKDPVAAALRVELLLKDRPDALALLKSVELISATMWVESQLQALNLTDRAAITAAWRQANDAAAQEAYAALNARSAASPSDFYAFWRRYPLSSAAVKALLAGGDRALLAGDFAGEMVCFSLAKTLGADLNAGRAVQLALAQQIESGSNAGSRYHGALAFDASWYGRADAASTSHYIPFVDGNLTFFASQRQMMAVRNTGELAWTWQPPRWSRDSASDRPSNAGRDQTFAISTLDSAESAQILFVRQPNPINRDNCIRAFRAADGRLVWSSENLKLTDDLTFISNPVAAGRFVYAVALAFPPGGGTSELQLVALDAMDGAILWRCGLGEIAEIGRWRDATAGRGWDNFWEQSAPCVWGDHVYLTPHVGAAFCVGRFDGKLQWARPYQEPKAGAEAEPFKRKGRAAKTAEIEAVSDSQMLRFTGAPVVAIDTGRPILVVAPQDSKGVYAFDALSGAALWNDADPQAPVLIGAAGDRPIFAGAFVTAVRPADGKTAWRWAPEKQVAITGPPAIVRDAIAIPTSRGMQWLNAADGKPINAAIATPSVHAMLVNENVRRLLDDSHIRPTLQPPGR